MLFDDSYFTIAGPSQGELRDRGSRFLAFAYPLENERQAKEILQSLKKEHPQANHHCYAYRLSPDPAVYRCSDDREPSGSAGRPILNALLSKGITDVLVVVVRYFGGTLLGVPGLVAAYRGAATDCLERASIIEKIIYFRYSIHFTFEHSNEVYQFLRNFQGKIIMQTMEELCTLQFEIRKSAAASMEHHFQQHSILSHKATLEPHI